MKCGGKMMCVLYDGVFDTTMPRHNSKNSEAGISYANGGPETEM